MDNLTLVCVTCGARARCDTTAELIELARLGWDTVPDTCPAHPAQRVATPEEAALEAAVEVLRGRA